MPTSKPKPTLDKKAWKRIELKHEKWRLKYIDKWSEPPHDWSSFEAIKKIVNAELRKGGRE